jgi:hypothetical protein
MCGLPSSHAVNVQSPKRARGRLHSPQNPRYCLKLEGRRGGVAAGFERELQCSVVMALSEIGPDLYIVLSRFDPCFARKKKEAFRGPFIMIGSKKESKYEGY